MYWSKNNDQRNFNPDPEELNLNRFSKLTNGKSRCFSIIHMFDFLCLSSCCDGKIRQALVGIVGLVKSHANKAWTLYHGTLSQMPNVASSLKAARQACGEWDYNANLAFLFPKFFPVGWIYCFVWVMKEISSGSLSEISPLSVGGSEFKGSCSIRWNENKDLNWIHSRNTASVCESQLWQGVEQTVTITLWSYTEDM